MSFSSDIENQALLKSSLAIITPRQRVTGWTLSSANVYSTPFTKGRVVAVWSYGSAFGFTEGAGPTGLGFDAFGQQGEFFQQDGVLYVGSQWDPDTNTPNLPMPGLTVEFEIHLASSPQTGYSDPTDASSPVVDYEGKLLSVPIPKLGSTVDILGFQPVNVDSISIANDGWLNPSLYDVSWNKAPVRVYFMVGKNFDDAFSRGSIKQVFVGYVIAIGESANQITVTCADYLSTLDKEIQTQPGLGFSMRYQGGVINPAIDPAAIVPGAEWFLRKIYGRVDRVKPVNLQYQVPALSTTNNRYWATHCYNGEAPGNISNTVDHAAANTNTRTYFLTTPYFAIGDRLLLVHSLTNYYAEVTDVNRALKYIEHVPILGRVIAPGDSGTRYFIGRVDIIDRNGTRWPLYPIRDYTMLTAFNAQALDGFQLVNNFEATVGCPSPFDPGQDEIVARVYGTPTLQTYSDATDVLSISPATGNEARAGSLVYRLLTESGIPKAMIDKSSFELAGADSHAMGYSVPETREELTLPTYKDIIARILQSGLLKLTLINTAGSEIYVGLVAAGPFATSGDYDISSREIAEVSWDQNYTDVYGEILAEYQIPNSDPPTDAERRYIIVENLVARHVHYIEKRYQVQLMQMDEDEAQEAANRIAYILSDRRMLYQLKLPQKYVDKAAIGVNFLTSRDHLPGFSYEFGTENQRTLGVVEVQKQIENVTITLDDQKGIQDNAGSW